jgi:GT2 family glycosyltransferase
MSDRYQLAASVIIPNWNGRRYLEACLSAVLVRSRVYGGFEVLLVDNGSSDGSVDYVRRHFPMVRVLALRANRGFAAACNLGIREAAGLYPVLLNNDAVVRPRWLEALVTAAERNPKAGAVASKLILKEPSGTINGAGLVLLSDGFGAARGWLEPDLGQFEAEAEVFGAPGNGVLLRREALTDVGLFDETFFAYYEDADLSWRMRLRGWHVIFEPHAVIEHVHAGTTRVGSPFFSFHVNRNRIFMLVKNGPAGFVLRAALRPAWDAGGSRRSQVRVKLRVLGSLLRYLPEMLAKRRRIRLDKLVPDAEVLSFVYPRRLWDERFRGA